MPLIYALNGDDWPVSQPVVFFGVIMMVIVQLLPTYSPPMQRVFGTEALGGIAWLLIIAVGVVIYAVVGIEKWLQKRTQAA